MTIQEEMACSIVRAIVANPEDYSPDMRWRAEHLAHKLQTPDTAFDLLRSPCWRYIREGLPYYTENE